jgi:predicted Rossmann fold nucleotide-binding protein DprA/Smf involved in DNA uptake
MRYGIVGNRIGFTYGYVKSMLDTLNIKEEDTLVSGGADGVDKFAERYATEKHCMLKVYLPDMTKPSPERYFERNRKIVDDSDVIIAFNRWQRSGTMNTINYARKQNKIGKIFDGELEISICNNCYYMTQTLKNGACGKCKIKKWVFKK